MTDVVLTYPTIFHEYNDEDGHYFVVDSPNIPGMVTEGSTHQEAASWAVDAIATMLDGEEYPQPQDPSDWVLEKSESIVFITVNMTEWLHKKEEHLAKRKQL
jgi:predicted RNase H-like HicB family nuclease